MMTELLQTLEAWFNQSDWWIVLIKDILLLAILLIAGKLSYWITKRWISAGILKVARRTPTRWDDYFFDATLFKRLGWVVGAVTVKIVYVHLSTAEPGVFLKVLDSLILFSLVRLVSSVLDGGNRIYESYPTSRDRPLKVFIQVIMIVVYFFSVIVIFGWLTGKEVGNLLTGLTVFASVLMLVFKDSILGFVAGIQLSANHMVRIGDWIEMPGNRADGDVLEINLTTVKVQNWDKTITTIPTYKLVSEAFTNWRGMEESSGRRIKRSVNIDVHSIHYLSSEELENLRQSALLKGYFEKKIAELDEYNANRGNTLDERRLTNIGTFREYLESWLANNPSINQEMTHMVRQLQPGPTGIPLEVYCFSALQQWIAYEKVQSDIFDHIYAILPLFGLRAFEYSALPGDHRK